MSAIRDENPGYWDHYSNHQHVKHDLIRQYLNGWLPKLGRWSGRIVYLDTHAGKGKHTSGELGSPLVALTTLINHRFRKTHFANCEIKFFYIEGDPRNARFLEKEIEAIKPLPPKVDTAVIVGDCFAVLNSMIEYLRGNGHKMAPAFVLVDPYGFKIPGLILRQLMEFPRVELFVNIIWRELGMAITHGAKGKGEWPGILNSIFDGADWQPLAALGGDDRADGAIDLFRRLTSARWATRIKMLGKNGTTRYMLTHLTNHEAGRDLMKDCMWKCCPEGGEFIVRITDDPRQKLIVKLDPDLEPLKKWVLDQLALRPRRWEDLIEEVRGEIWRKEHLNKVIRSLKNSRPPVIGARGFRGRCVPSSNPELFLI